MPLIYIEIGEQQEAKIIDLIDGRRNFQITGGRVLDSDGKKVFLRHAEFVFHPDSFNGIDKQPSEIKPIT